jgi:hypothetical protein
VALLVTPAFAALDSFDYAEGTTTPVTGGSASGGLDWKSGGNDNWSYSAQLTVNAANQATYPNSATYYYGKRRVMYAGAILAARPVGDPEPWGYYCTDLVKGAFSFAYDHINEGTDNDWGTKVGNPDGEKERYMQVRTEYSGGQDISIGFCNSANIAAVGITGAGGTYGTLGDPGLPNYDRIKPGPGYTNADLVTYWNGWVGVAGTSVSDTMRLGFAVNPYAAKGQAILKMFIREIGSPTPLIDDNDYVLKYLNYGLGCPIPSTVYSVNFGIKPNGSTTGGNAIFDNVEVIIPEPATMTMLVLGGITALLRRRR